MHEQTQDPDRSGLTHSLFHLVGRYVSSSLAVIVYFILITQIQNQNKQIVTAWAPVN